MNYSKLSYGQCVTKAKDLLQNIKQTKYEVCLLTLRVCDIRVGGHTPNGDIYSIAKFAKDIGMKKHTLRKWLEEHRNVVEKLPKNQKLRTIE